MVEINLPATTIGDKNTFAIGYMFPFDSDAESTVDRYFTRAALYVGGRNLLGFTTERVDPPVHGTLQWDLDEAVEFLDEFARNSREEPFPFPDVPGDTLAELDYNARKFETDDVNAFLAYDEKLGAFVWPRSWHHTCAEAVFPHVYFRVLGGRVEVSWDNREAEEGVRFDSERGSALVPLATFRDVVSRFVAAYLRHWGGYAWDRVGGRGSD